MTSKTAAISWYAQRLARMSAREIGHRLTEQAKRLVDGRRRFGWDRFGSFGGPIGGLPGLARSVDHPAFARRDVATIERGKFDLLGTAWPMPDPDRRWYDDGTIWLRDPVSSALWPGSDTFAFRVPYRRDGKYGDVKFVWELNRLQMLQSLAAAGATDAIAPILESWMAANPPFQGINWTNGIEAASRIVSLLVVLTLADKELLQSLDGPARKLLAAHTYWIARYPSLYSSANNHRVAELAALFLAAIVAPGLPGADHYRSSCKPALENLADCLFHADGVGAEQSPSYAAYSLEWFALAGIAADAAGLPFSPKCRERLRAAARHLRWMMDDQGRVPRIGDDDEGRVLASPQDREDRYVASVAALVARWLDDPDSQPPATDPHLRDQLLPAPAKTASTATSKPSGMRVFPEGGYTVVRTPTARGTLLFVIDHGPLGFASIAAHGHADALSVWLHWGDEAIFVDAGTYLYHAGGRDRDLFRGTGVHNTLTVEGADQSTIAGPFMWSRHARSRIVEQHAASICVEHDGYVQPFGLRHRRRVEWEPDGTIVIDDCLLGSIHEPLRWAVGFTLGEGIVPHIDGTRADLTTAAGRHLTLELRGPGRAWTLVQAPYSPAFNRREVRPRLCVTGEVSHAVATVRIRPSGASTKRDLGARTVRPNASALLAEC